MRGPVIAVALGQLKLVNGAYLISRQAVLRALDIEVEHNGAVRLHHAGLVWNALINQEMGQRIVDRLTYTPDVVVAVSRVDARAGVYQLAHGARRLDHGDRRAGVDAQPVSPRGVDRLDHVRSSRNHLPSFSIPS